MSRGPTNIVPRFLPSDLEHAVTYNDLGSELHGRITACMDRVIANTQTGSTTDVGHGHMLIITGPNPKAMVRRIPSERLETSASVLPLEIDTTPLEQSNFR